MFTSPNWIAPFQSARAMSVSFLDRGNGGIAAGALDANARDHMPCDEGPAFPAGDERSLCRARAPASTAGCAATGLEIVGTEQHDGISPASRAAGVAYWYR